MRRVMQTCRSVDQNARLVTMTKDSYGHCHLRVRAGDVHSVASLQRALEDAMPLSTATVLESWIDGTLEAEITVYTKDEERCSARKLVVKRRLFKYWIAFSWILLALGFCEWVATLRTALDPRVLRDEL